MEPLQESDMTAVRMHVTFRQVTMRTPDEDGR